MNRQRVSQPVSENSRKIPPGLISIWSSSTIPNGWLLCDGTGYATTAYPALYAVIGTTYGSSGGFQVPDLRKRVPYYNFGTAGGTGGVSTVQLTAAESGLKSHSHTVSDYYPHNDFAGTYDAAGPTSLKEIANATETTSGVYVGTTSYPSGIGASAAHTNLQPYILVNFIIKY